MKAWQSKGKLFDFKFRKFYEYNSRIDFEGYDGEVWKFINPPGWEKFLEPRLSNAEDRVLKWSLKDVCEFQYKEANKWASESLAKICEGLSARERAKKVIEINYEDMISNKVKTFSEICDFLDIDFSLELQSMIERDPKVSRI